MYTTSDLEKGLIIDLDGAPHIVEASTVSSPSARGGSTIHRVKLRNLKTGQRVDKNFRGGDTFAVPDVDRRPVQFLYSAVGSYHFMDQESFDQFELGEDELQWERNFLVEGIEGLRAFFYNGAPIALEMPNKVNLTITETAPGVKGNSATGRTKAATLETGFVLQLPEHVEQGVRITVDTRTGEFLGRAKD
jgi:elongation factor P